MTRAVTVEQLEALGLVLNLGSGAASIHTRPFQACKVIFECEDMYRPHRDEQKEYDSRDMHFPKSHQKYFSLHYWRVFIGLAPQYLPQGPVVLRPRLRTALGRNPPVRARPRRGDAWAGKRGRRSHMEPWSGRGEDPYQPEARIG